MAMDLKAHAHPEGGTQPLIVTRYPFTAEWTWTWGTGLPIRLHAATWDSIPEPLGCELRAR